MLLTAGVSAGRGLGSTDAQLLSAHPPTARLQREEEEARTLDQHRGWKGDGSRDAVPPAQHMKLPNLQGH